ncbi:CdaR family transcriptional regulator [Fictibacillus fluitans]|uniref:Sugar diacid recognition domain-containing protein n=1 Tax=Fictibacillus fluitans TaxID=3058422 RepID=A0ABT8HXP2_9BACL|nr:sugar diacid recognition domain-containing protein [Fictibacillus sp. NE201]MDN4525550.1 sugar diacid recognition domain-containing protein [Fictibacillus sp. NE201]
MQFLTHELANEIVERTMKILNQNINVMNNEGVIIGSGESERMNQIHDGALLVLQKGESVEIDSRKAGEMKGAKPGINLPIRFNNQIVGVIGITGEPEDIKHYAQLVKMAAELVLEQSFLLERVQWKQRMQSEIVNLLISEEQVDEERTKERAALLGIHLEKPRTVLLLKSLNSEDISNHTLARLVQYEMENTALTGITFNNEVVVLKETGIVHSKESINILSKRLQKAVGEDVLLGWGQPARNLNEIKISFRQAKKAIQVGVKLKPALRYYDYEDFQLEILLSKLVQNEHEQQIFGFYERLLDRGRKGELTDTLEAYFREGGELNKIAESLFIHRNTLRYRLDKIKELTGKDPRQAKDLIQLYMASVLHDVR